METSTPRTEPLPSSRLRFNLFGGFLIAICIGTQPTSAALLNLGPNYAAGRGPAAGSLLVGGNLPGVPELSIGSERTSLPVGPGRLYLGFAQPFTFGSGVDFALDVYDGSGPVEFDFYMNYTLVGASVADISSIGVNLFDIPLNGVIANNVVVINENPPVSGVGFDVGVDIGFLDAGVEYPVAGAGAPPFNSAHPAYDYVVPEPSSLALILFGSAGLLLLHHRTKARGA